MRYLLLSILIFQTGLIFSQNEENYSCDVAIELQLGDNCFIHSNSESNGESTSSCNENAKKDIWYHFIASQSSLHSIEAKLTEMDSFFNNVITIYSGNCGNLVEISCVNDDEYGFLGEKAFLTTIQSNDYYVKVSGIANEFGRISGLNCIALNSEMTEPESSANDLCEQASILDLNDEWKSFENTNASLEGNHLSYLERNRADVWFSFIPNINTDVEIEVIADFSHTIGLYQGDCNNILLLDSNLNGFDLTTDNLLADQIYYIQISGRFATLEGDFDIRIKSAIDTNVNNEDCLTSTTYENGCMPFSTLSSSFSGHYPSCLFYAQNDIWFNYQPLQSGTHKLSIKTDYLSAVAFYRNDCDALEEIACGSVSACDGALEIKNLIANENYLVQVLTNNEYFANEGGQGCLEIKHISDYDYIPLDLKVQVVCISEDVAKLNIEAKNGSGNYTFNGNADGEELLAGDTYFVQVTDDSGCQKIKHGVVACDQANNECQLFYDVELTDVDCNTQSGGSAIVTVYTDVDYSISWPSGSTSNVISDLTTGQYSVSITNNSIGSTCTYLFEISEQIETYQLYYADMDNDGFGDPNNFVNSCNSPEGFVQNSSDCDDLNELVNANNVEVPYNGIDDDCDSNTLDDDLDQDGFALADDCDDTDAAVNAMQEEIAYNGLDDDCDPSTLDDDLDQDGFALVDDCDDANAEVNSSQTEIPYNGIDDDCDSSTLDDDLDQDGYALVDDCDDANAEVNSSQTEIPYNGIDDDCDDSTLDDDLDQDGFAFVDDCDDENADVNTSQTEIPYNGVDDDCDDSTLDDDLDQDGFALLDDCDDTDSSINTSQEEIPYNGIDDDCNTITLDDDLDQDGFLFADDCDDTDPSINPDAEEIPDNDIDENCDGDVILTSTTDFINGNINVYPNPTSDRLTVSGIENKNFTINLYNLTGILVVKDIKTKSFSVGHLVSGTYLLKLVDLDSGRFIVEKIFVL